jgi:energy-coupling factor transporter ATP-binding protein EcfA2
MRDEPLDLALARVRVGLAKVHLPLPLPSAKPAADFAKRQVDQLDDYILPRLDEQSAPLLVVVGGSTGAGKSTLVNSLVGRTVSPSSVLRPTTRIPILVHNPADQKWFEARRILPGLVRSSTATDQPGTLQLVGEPTLPAGLAILDAPDVDSVVTENRVLAAQLLDAADMWLFLTTAARYADAVPWDHLKQAVDRNVLVAMVLDRVPPAALEEVPSYQAAKMKDRGLGASKLFCIPETDLEQGLLPAANILEIKTWLANLANNTEARKAVVAQTLGGAVAAMVRNGPQVVAAIRDQQRKLAFLTEAVEKSYAEALQRIQDQTADGSMLRGEVLAKWHDFVGTGQFFRAVEQRIGTLRDRISSFFTGSSVQAAEVGTAIESGLDILVRQEAESAAGRIYEAWNADPAGKSLIAAADWNLSRGSAELPGAASALVKAWQADVLKLVSETSVSKRAKARYLALGVNGVGVALMILVFSHTGGLLGAEVGIAGGTAVLAQRVLEAVFGEDAVRQLAKESKTGLESRIRELLEAEKSRYQRLLGDLNIDVTGASELEGALRLTDIARQTDDRLSEVA